ncbi:hypothetical protein PVK06_016955 [Gossypium arboreum]|uniref:Transposase MuDR plant domain-containing protein n=1 Tax=Gossypium arboreum TaxID=29729 RepID=A0ABR0Q1V1_GOSAR|nr:hypothetical protein PVK06_016955 [Gossypium arboreum]
MWTKRFLRDALCPCFSSVGIRLYVQVALPNDAFATSTSTAVQEEYTTSARDSASGWQNTEASVFCNNMEYTTPGRDSISTWDMHLEVALFSEPKPIPTILEDVEGGSDEEEEDPRFRAYSSPVHMHNVDLSQDDALEFPDLPHRRRDRTSSSLDSGELEVGKVFSNKDSFLGALKQHSIIDGVNYNVVKSKTDKFEAKCAVKDNTCSWKIMALLRKKTSL